MDNTLSAYEAAIVDWNNYRTSSESILSLIEKGSYFQISRAMYDFWTNNSPDYIHAYLGVVENPDQELGFILIDSTCDSDPNTVIASNITYAPYCEGFENMPVIPPFSPETDPGENITILQGLERSFRWSLSRKNYIENKVAEGASETAGIFQAFKIPIGDLDSIFSDADTDNALVIIGLQADNTTSELILWSENFNPSEDVEDVAYPVPPFDALTDFNLLTMALNL